MRNCYLIGNRLRQVEAYLACRHVQRLRLPVVRLDDKIFLCCLYLHSDPFALRYTLRRSILDVVNSLGALISSHFEWLLVFIRRLHFSPQLQFLSCPQVLFAFDHPAFKHSTHRVDVLVQLINLQCGLVSGAPEILALHFVVLNYLGIVLGQFLRRLANQLHGDFLLLPRKFKLHIHVKQLHLKLFDVPS